MNIGSIVMEDDVDYLDIDEKNQNFITFSRVKKENKNVWCKPRNNIRVGKFFKKYFIFDNNQIENLVNQFKTLHTIEIGDINKLFDIVNGEKIFHYYKSENNVPGGSLDKSCMRNSSKKRLKLYIDNPKKINLLILKDNNSDRIRGRALLWKTRDGYYVDRPYCSDDKDLFLFKRYSEEYSYKYYHTNKDILYVDIFFDKRNEYPYLDSFTFSHDKQEKVGKISKYFKRNNKMTLISNNNQIHHDIVENNIVFVEI